MPIFTLCVRMYVCKYVYLCIYVCMYDARHDIQIPCTRYVAINRIYLYLYLFYLINTPVVFLVFVHLPILLVFHVRLALCLSKVFRPTILPSCPWCSSFSSIYLYC